MRFHFPANMWNLMIMTMNNVLIMFTCDVDGQKKKRDGGNEIGFNSFSQEIEFGIHLISQYEWDVFRI